MSDTALPVIFRFDTTANRTAFTPTPGVSEQLYIWLDSDDEPNAYYWDGAAWQAFNASAPSAQVYKLTFVFDGGGSPLAAATSVAVSAPVSGTIVRARLMADQSGDAVVDVWMDDFASYPPTDADTITGGNEPELTADAAIDDTTLTSWTTTVTAGDVLKANIDSVDGTIEWLVLEIWIQP